MSVDRLVEEIAEAKILQRGVDSYLQVQVYAGPIRGPRQRVLD